jgi:hypothetical protein
LPAASVLDFSGFFLDAGIRKSYHSTCSGWPADAVDREANAHPGDPGSCRPSVRRSGPCSASGDDRSAARLVVRQDEQAGTLTSTDRVPSPSPGIRFCMEGGTDDA